MQRIAIFIFLMAGLCAAEDFTIQARQYFRVQISPNGLALDARLLAPDGTELTSAVNEAGEQQPVLSTIGDPMQEANARYLLAKAYRATGDPSHAIEQIDRALQVGEDVRADEDKEAICEDLQLCASVFALTIFALMPSR